MPDDADAFEEWMAEADGALVAEVGLSADDLPDQTWYDWYSCGLTPREAAAAALRNEGYGEED